MFPYNFVVKLHVFFLKTQTKLTIHYFVTITVINKALNWSEYFIYAGSLHECPFFSQPRSTRLVYCFPPIKQTYTTTPKHNYCRAYWSDWFLLILFLMFPFFFTDAVTRSAAFFATATILLCSGYCCSIIGQCARHKGLYTFISGIVFIVTGTLWGRIPFTNGRVNAQ